MTSRVDPTHVAVIAVVIVVFFAVAAAGAQPMTRCAACHFANLSDVPAPAQLADWQHSRHARQAVGCHECHGGDPWTYVPADAHRTVVAPANPSSPVHPANLARTCARCHPAMARAFSGTLHQTLVQAGDLRAPTCTTCHGTMRADVPSPAALEARCAECHPAGSARDAYPALMRAAVESINELRARAEALDDRIAQVPRHARRVELLVVLHDARSALKESIACVHTFDVRQVNERIAAAQRELDALAKAAAFGADGER
jgi:cytochrome c7-like protein